MGIGSVDVITFWCVSKTATDLKQRHLADFFLASFDFISTGGSHNEMVEVFRYVCFELAMPYCYSPLNRYYLKLCSVPILSKSNVANLDLVTNWTSRLHSPDEMIFICS